MNRHAKTWKDNPQPAIRGTRLEPAVPLHRGREYHDAASHSDITRFLLRQVERGLRRRA